MEDLLFSLNIVLPMAILLAMGYIFKQIGFFTDGFISTGKKFCFYCLLSCSLFKNLYDSSLDVLPVRLVIFVVCGIIFEFIAAYFIAQMIADKKDEKGVIIQGAVRSNYVYIGIPLASMMFADSSLIALTRSEASMLSIFVVPLFNIICVMALVYYSESQDGDRIMNRTLKNIIKNPCILSILLGLLILLIRLIFPASAFFIKNDLSFLYKVLTYMAEMSTPFAFIMVGAGLDFSHSIKNIKKLIIVVGLRILIFPAIILFTAYKLGSFINADFAVLVSVFASPTAVASAIMASELGGDHELASEIVVYSAAFSMFSLLLIIFALKTVNCL